MKKRALSRVVGIVVGAALTCFTTAAALAQQAGHEEHHPPAEQGAAPVKPGMMGQMMQEMMGQGKSMMEPGKGMMAGGMPCLMDPASPSSMLHMMGGALSGRMALAPAMMQRMMDRTFFLDRAEELGLSVEQTTSLKAIRAACRKDNIRTGAEVRIVRLELDDLLSGNRWALEEADKLIRQVQKLEGDMQVRHLKAVTEARKVLTAEQLKRVESGPKGESLEQLF